MVYVTPACFAHPNCRAFWLGGGSEGRRAQGQSVGDSVGEGETTLRALAFLTIRTLAI